LWELFITGVINLRWIVYHKKGERIMDETTGMTIVTSVMIIAIFGFYMWLAYWWR